MNDTLLWVLRIVTVMYIAAAFFVPFRYIPGGSGDVRGSIVIFFAFALILPLYPIWKWINKRSGIPEIKTLTSAEDHEARETLKYNRKHRRKKQSRST